MAFKHRRLLAGCLSFSTCDAGLLSRSVYYPAMHGKQCHVCETKSITDKLQNGGIRRKLETLHLF
jgi:hypothetical protein